MQAPRDITHRNVLRRVRSVQKCDASHFFQHAGSDADITLVTYRAALPDSYQESAWLLQGRDRGDRGRFEGRPYAARTHKAVA